MKSTSQALCLSIVLVRARDWWELHRAGFSLLKAHFSSKGVYTELRMHQVCTPLSSSQEGLVRCLYLQRADRSAHGFCEGTVFSWGEQRGAHPYECCTKGKTDILTFFPQFSEILVPESVGDICIGSEDSQLLQESKDPRVCDVFCRTDLTQVCLLVWWDSSHLQV